MDEPVSAWLSGEESTKESFFSCASPPHRPTLGKKQPESIETVKFFLANSSSLVFKLDEISILIGRDPTRLCDVTKI